MPIWLPWIFRGVVSCWIEGWSGLILFLNILINNMIHCQKTHLNLMVACLANRYYVYIRKTR